MLQLFLLLTFGVGTTWFSILVGWLRERDQQARDPIEGVNLKKLRVINLTFFPIFMS